LDSRTSSLLLMLVRLEGRMNPEEKKRPTRLLTMYDTKLNPFEREKRGLFCIEVCWMLTFLLSPSAAPSVVAAAAVAPFEVVAGVGTATSSS